MRPIVLRQRARPEVAAVVRPGAAVVEIRCPLHAFLRLQRRFATAPPN